jgi:glycosyltransferase involved in cell wall biosynthesis
MKILHVISSIDARQGGTSEMVLQFGREALRQGHEVEIATVDNPAAEWIRDFPLTLHALGPGWTAYAYSGKFQRWLHANVRRFDAVIVHGLWQFTGVAVRRACQETETLPKQPYFVYTHGMLDPYFDRFPLKRLKKNLFWWWADYLVLRDARTIFFTAEEERRGAHVSFKSLRGDESIAPLGIDDPPPFSAVMREAFQEAVPGLEKRPYLLFLGRIHRKKGCDMLLRVWPTIAADNPDLCLVMAGPDQTGWTPKLKKISNERVFWPGMLTGNAKWGALRGAAAFILPSHQENFGLAIVESLACSTPVLISRKVNIWREIALSSGGYAEDPDDIGTRFMIERYLELSKPQKASFRYLARSTFEKHFLLSKAVENLHRQITDCLKRRSY